MERIESRNNPLIKWVAQLQNKKYREEHQAFLLDGYKLIEEALLAKAPITHLFVLEDQLKTYENFINKIPSSVRIYIVTNMVFQKISQENAPQGLIAVVSYLDNIKKNNIINIYDKKHILILYNIQDPGNLGAIMRSALAFGTKEILLTEDCCDVYNSKAIRASMGALFHLKMFYTSQMKETVMNLLKEGRNIYAAELTKSAIPICDVQFKESDGIIIGNEGHGIPEELSNLATGSIYIPISQNSESLNASVAASILLYELGK